jgi:hypothetical protein
MHTVGQFAPAPIDENHSSNNSNGSRSSVAAVEKLPLELVTALGDGDAHAAAKHAAGEDDGDDAAEDPYRRRPTSASLAASPPSSRHFVVQVNPIATQPPHLTTESRAASDNKSLLADFAKGNKNMAMLAQMDVKNRWLVSFSIPIFVRIRASTALLLSACTRSGAQWS